MGSCAAFTWLRFPHHSQQLVKQLCCKEGMGWGQSGGSCQLWHCVDQEIFPIRWEWEVASREIGRWLLPCTTKGKRVWLSRESSQLRNGCISIQLPDSLQRVRIQNFSSLWLTWGWAEAEHGEITVDAAVPRAPRLLPISVPLQSLSACPGWDQQRIRHCRRRGVNLKVKMKQKTKQKKNQKTTQNVEQKEKKTFWNEQNISDL